MATSSLLSPQGYCCHPTQQHRRMRMDSKPSAVVPIFLSSLMRPLYSNRSRLLFNASLYDLFDCVHSAPSPHCVQKRSWSKKSKTKEKDAASSTIKGQPPKVLSRVARRKKEKESTIEANQRREKYQRAVRKRKLHPAAKWKRILSACDFWFSRANLMEDEFIREKLKRFQGWIPLKTLLTFPKFQHWTDAQLLMDAFNSTAGHRYVVKFDKTLHNLPKKKKKETNLAPAAKKAAAVSVVDRVDDVMTTTTVVDVPMTIPSPTPCTDNSPATADHPVTGNRIRDVLKKHDEWLPVRALLSIFTAIGIVSAPAAAVANTKETGEKVAVTSEPIANVEKGIPPKMNESELRICRENGRSSAKVSHNESNDELEDRELTNDMKDEQIKNDDDEDWDSTDYEDDPSDDDDTKDHEDEKDLFDDALLDSVDWPVDDHDDGRQFEDEGESGDFETSGGDLIVIGTQSAEPQSLNNAFVRHRRVTLQYIELIEYEIRQEQQEYQEAMKKYEKYYTQNPNAVFMDAEKWLLKNGEVATKSPNEKKNMGLEEFTTKREVVVLRSAKGLEKFCNDLVRSARATAAKHGENSKACAIGFDAEYCSLELDIRNTLPAMIQLSAPIETGPVGLLWLDKFPDHGRDVLTNAAYAPLTALLADSTILKVGVSASFDVQHLARWWSIDDKKYIGHFFSGIVDIEEELDENVNGKSLQEMAELVMQRRLSKMKEKKRRNDNPRQRRKTPTAHWRTDHLTDRMKTYAVNDAACAVDVWMKINGFGPKEDAVVKKKMKTRPNKKKTKSE